MKKYKEFIMENTTFAFPMPIASKSVLFLYYICNDCKMPFISLNKKMHKCDVCGSIKIRTINENEYYSYIKSIVSPKGWNMIQTKRKEFENELVNIIPSKKSIIN